MAENTSYDFSDHLVAVGGPFWRGPGPYPMDMLQFNYDANGFGLVISFPDFTAHEVEQFHRGDYEFGAYDEDGTLFFLFKNPASNGWADCPYSWHRVRPENRNLPEPYDDPNTRFLLTIFIVDGSQNRVLALRAITIPPEVSRVLANSIRDQSLLGSDYDYDQKVSSIRSRLTGDQMAAAGVTGKGGA